MINADKLLGMYKNMYQSRYYEEISVQLNKEKKIVGSIHAGEGEEACGVGIVSAMKPEDILSPSYRDISAVIAKGVTLKEMTCLLYGKQHSITNGRTRTLHVGDLDRGILPGNPILGASTAVAIGAALASKKDDAKRVVVNIFGDGALNEGAVYESMNFASVFKLPIVFVIVNNRYAWSTPTNTHNNLTILADRAKAYGIKAYIADGNDVMDVNDVVSKAVEAARAGEGPAIVELRAYRWSGHSGNDKNVYREMPERIWHKLNDPVKRVHEYLIQMEYISEEELNKWEAEMKQEVDDAYEYARNDEDPKPEDVLDINAMMYLK